MIEFIENLSKYSDVIMFVFIIIITFFLGYVLGWCKSISTDLNDNFKSMDYDRVVAENKKLKEVINIKRNVK